MIDALSQHNDAALARGGYPPGEPVLDVGRGFGGGTLRIAGMVGASGETVGTDCADRATHFIAEAEKTNAESSD